MRISLFWLLFALLAFAACDDDASSGNNTSNTNNANNTSENTNNANNTSENTNNTQACPQDCALWEECVEGSCQPRTCEPACDEDFEVCIAGADGTSECAALTWEHQSVTIEDPVVNGSSLMMPVDGISFAVVPEAFQVATSFGRDMDDPTLTWLWIADYGLGTHYKLPLTGDVFSESENFCMDEQWCQLISFDVENDTFVVAAPRAQNLMEVSREGAAQLRTVTGPIPANGNISYTSRFDWESRTLYIYGYLGPSAFGSTVHALDLDAGVWSEAATGLPQVYDNCIVVDPVNQVLLSFGGNETTDGGESSHLLDTVTTVDLTDGSHSTSQLPATIGPRASLSCALLPDTGEVLVYGGAVMNDRYNEILNEYHADMYLFNPTTGAWTALMPDSAGGTFEDPDQYGDQAFVGDPEGPHFGMNKGHMVYDEASHSLLIIGAVPIFTHEQLYTLDLTLLDPLTL